MAIEDENLYPSQKNDHSENDSSSPVTFEVLDNVDDKIIDDVCSLHNRSFPKSFHLKKDYYREMIENKKKIGTCVTCMGMLK